jgi:hypothetical protein
MGGWPILIGEHTQQENSTSASEWRLHSCAKYNWPCRPYWFAIDGKVSMWTGVPGRPELSRIIRLPNKKKVAVRKRIRVSKNSSSRRRLSKRTGISSKRKLSCRT